MNDARHSARPGLAVFDVDGTLVSFDGTCSEATRQTLIDLRAAGVVTAIATGRPRAALPETLAKTGPVDYAVCGNGSSVIHLESGTVVRESTLPADLAVSIVEAVRRAVPDVGVAIEFGDRVIEEAGLHRRLPPRDPVPVVDDALAAAGLPVPDPQRLTFFHDDHDEDLPGLAALIEPHADDRVDLFYGVLLAVVEVVPAGNNKAAALEDLVRHLGAEAASAIAFGDGSNDIDMLAWAGTGVAMGGAKPNVVAAADTTTASVEHDGVATFIDRLLHPKRGV